MLSTIITILDKSLPPPKVSSRISIIAIALITVWAVAHQSSANVHVAVQKTQFDQIIDNQRKLEEKLDKLDGRVSNILERLPSQPISKNRK